MKSFSISEWNTWKIKNGKILLQNHCWFAKTTRRHTTTLLLTRTTSSPAILRALTATEWLTSTVSTSFTFRMMSPTFMRPSWWAAPPWMIFVMKILGSLSTWGLSFPPAMLNPRPAPPYIIKQTIIILIPNGKTIFMLYRNTFQSSTIV